MLLEDFCYAYGHGAVEECHDVGDLFLHDEFVEVVHQFLGAFNGEGRDYEISAGVFCFVDDLGESCFYVGDGFVVPVSVGRFDDDEVSLGEYFGIAEDGSVGSSDVSGEENGFGVAVGFQGDFNHGSAEDVSGVVECCGDGVCELYGLSVFYSGEEFVACFGVFGGVDGFDGSW